MYRLIKLTEDEFKEAGNKGIKFNREVTSLVLEAMMLCKNNDHENDIHRLLFKISEANFNQFKIISNMRYGKFEEEENING